MAVRLDSVLETILYEYAKLIADRAVEDRSGVAAAARSGSAYWSFVTRTFTKLKAGELEMSGILRENKLFVENADRCAYCGVDGPLQWEHIVPLSRGGPDSIDNLVMSCPRCNREKAARNPVEWYDARGLDRRHVPRLVMGKLLKMTAEQHRLNGTLLAREYPAGAGLHLVNVVLVFDQPKDGQGLSEQT